MTPGQRLKRGLEFIRQLRQFKIVSVRVHHSGWSEERVANEVRRWVRDGMKPKELLRSLVEPFTMLISTAVKW
jgi:hypothetical protein